MPPSNESKSIRVLLVDDHPIVRRALEHIIGKEDDMTICGEAGDAADGLEAVLDLKPDLAVVDISLKGKSGIELIKDIRARKIRMPIVVLSVHEETTYAERALSAGAQGYIGKDEAPKVIVAALRKVLGGDVYVADAIAARLFARTGSGRVDPREDAVSSLSDRELEVLEMIGQGRGTRDIASRLNLSVSTVETHRANIKAKLNLAGGSELARYATEWVLGRG